MTSGESCEIRGRLYLRKRNAGGSDGSTELRLGLRDGSPEEGGSAAERLVGGRGG